jgi:hypothetical protein
MVQSLRPRAGGPIEPVAAGTANISLHLVNALRTSANRPLVGDARTVMPNTCRRSDLSFRYSRGSHTLHPNKEIS